MFSSEDTPDTHEEARFVKSPQKTSQRITDLGLCFCWLLKKCSVFC